MDNFTENIVTQIQRSVIKKISSGDWLTFDYSNRPKIPGDLLYELYNMVDIDRVLALAAANLEQKIADKLIVALTVEVKNDIKQVMSNKELREELRSVIREKLKAHNFGDTNG